MEPLYSKPHAGEEFAQAEMLFQTMEGWLKSPTAMELTHGELEERLDVDGRELLRQLLQAHLGWRAHHEERLAQVMGSDGERRTLVEPSQRRLMTVFGSVVVERLAYRARGLENLYPADGHLNLPVESHSHGLRKRDAQEASRGSYDEVVTAVTRWSGGRVAKRQAEQLACRAAQDFDAFYEKRSPAQRQASLAGMATTLMGLTLDGKGLVMRPEALTDRTNKAADKTQHKLGRRLSKGEKNGRKRMATVGAVYDIAPYVRSPQEVLGDLAPIKAVGPPRPRPANKRVWASVQRTPPR